jgi:tetratricopeptide (TPR) repeat protein
MKSISKLKDEARRHEQKEEWEKAIQVYLQVLRAGDDGEIEVELPLFNRIGDLMVRLGRPHEAVRHYEQAADRYADVGLYNNAIALCNKALRYQPDHLELMRKLGQFSALQGFLTDARRYFLDYAERKFAMGETEDAFAALESFAGIADDGDVRELLGRRLQAHGRMPEALAALHRAHDLHQQSGDADRAAAVMDLIRTIDPASTPDPGSAVGPAPAPADAFEDILDDEIEWDVPAASESLAAEPTGVPAGEQDITIHDLQPTAVDGSVAGADFDLPEIEMDTVDTPDTDAPSVVEGLETTTFDFGTVTGAPVDVDFGLNIETEIGPSFDFETIDEVGAEYEALGLEGLQDLQGLQGIDDLEGLEVLEGLDRGAHVARPADDDALGEDAFGALDDDAPVENALDENALDENALDAAMLDVAGLDVSGLEFEVFVTDSMGDAPTGDEAFGLGGEYEREGVDAAPAEGGDDLPWMQDDEETSFDLPLLEAEGGAGAEGAAVHDEELAGDEPFAAFEYDAALPIDPEIFGDALDAGGEAPATTAFPDAGTLDGPLDAYVEERADEYDDLDDAEAALPLLGGATDFDADAQRRAAEAALAELSATWLPDLSLPALPEDVTEEEEEAPEAAPPEDMAPPEAMAPPEEDSGYIDLAVLLQEDEKLTTRFQVLETAPTGDDDADFADLLSQFKAKISDNLPVEDAAAHYDLALAFKEMGLLDDAIAEFQVAFRAERMRLKICEELGDCFLQKQQYTIAEKVLLRALQLKREDELELLGIYYHLGRTYEELGRTDDARDAFERVLALDINFQDVPQRLSRL